MEISGHLEVCAFIEFLGLGVVVKGSSLFIYTVLIYMLSRRFTNTVGSDADETVTMANPRRGSAIEASENRETA